MKKPCLKQGGPQEPDTYNFHLTSTNILHPTHMHSYIHIHIHVHRDISKYNKERLWVDWKMKRYHKRIFGGRDIEDKLKKNNKRKCVWICKNETQYGVC